MPALFLPFLILRRPEEVERDLSSLCALPAVGVTCGRMQGTDPWRQGRGQPVAVAADSVCLSVPSATLGRLSVFPFTTDSLH